MAEAWCGRHAERRIASGDQGAEYRASFKKGQYSAAYSGFEGIEDNTDRIQTREEVEAEQSAGKTLANALKAAGVSRVDVVASPNRIVSRTPRSMPRSSASRSPCSRI